MSSTELPVGSQTIEKSEAPSNVVSIDAAIEKSKNEIHAAHGAPKRGRGRPRKVRPEEAPASMPTPASVAPSASVPTPEINLTPIFSQAVRFPFDVAAAKYKCPELAVTDDEVKEPAELANQLFQVYAPELASSDPKKLLAWTLAISLAMLTVKKIGVYHASVSNAAGTDDSQNALATAASSTSNENPAPTAPQAPASEAAFRGSIFPTQSADGYFRRERPLGHYV